MASPPIALTPALLRTLSVISGVVLRLPVPWFPDLQNVSDSRNQGSFCED